MGSPRLAAALLHCCPLLHLCTDLPRILSSRSQETSPLCLGVSAVFSFNLYFKKKWFSLSIASYPTGKAEDVKQESRLTRKCLKAKYCWLSLNPSYGPEGMHPKGQTSQEAAATLNASSWESVPRWWESSTGWENISEIAFKTRLP